MDPNKKNPSDQRARAQAEAEAEALLLLDDGPEMPPSPGKPQAPPVPAGGQGQPVLEDDFGDGVAPVSTGSATPVAPSQGPSGTGTRRDVAGDVVATPQQRERVLGLGLGPIRMDSPEAKEALTPAPSAIYPIGFPGEPKAPRTASTSTEGRERDKGSPIPWRGVLNDPDLQKQLGLAEPTDEEINDRLAQAQRIESMRGDPRYPLTTKQIQTRN